MFAVARLECAVEAAVCFKSEDDGAEVGFVVFVARTGLARVDRKTERTNDDESALCIFTFMSSEEICLPGGTHNSIIAAEY